MENEKSNVSSKRIKALRLKNGYTVEKLADLIGVSKSTISKWENGYVDNMRQDKVFELSKIFNVSPTYIMGYDDISEPSTKDAEQTQKFIAYYEQLNPEQRVIVDNLLAALVKKQ